MSEALKIKASVIQFIAIYYNQKYPEQMAAIELELSLETDMFCWGTNLCLRFLC